MRFSAGHPIRTMGFGMSPFLGRDRSTPLLGCARGNLNLVCVWLSQSNAQAHTERICEASQVWDVRAPGGPDNSEARQVAQGRRARRFKGTAAKGTGGNVLVLPAPRVRVCVHEDDGRHAAVCGATAGRGPPRRGFAAASPLRWSRWCCTRPTLRSWSR